MKKITIKFKEIGGFGGTQFEFRLPDGRKLEATEIGYEYVTTGDYAEPSQYRYKSKNYDEFGFEVDRFDGKNLVEYQMGGFVSVNEPLLKLAKKILLYFCKSGADDYKGSYEMPERYLELIKGETK